MGACGQGPRLSGITLARQVALKVSWAFPPEFLERIWSGGEIQARTFGTKFAIPHRVEKLVLSGHGHFDATLNGGSLVCARSVVVATRVQYRCLPVDRLANFEGAGLYCAATDIEARFCTNSEVFFISGENSAGQAAMFLSRSAKHVHMLIRGKSLTASMSDYLLSRIEADPAITIHYEHALHGLEGGDELTHATIHNRADDCHWHHRTRTVFMMVAAAPNTGWLADMAALDDKGFVRTGREVGGKSPYETSHAGIIAVGDVLVGSVKRVASSVGEGSVVISNIWNHVNA